MRLDSPFKMIRPSTCTITLFPLWPLSPPTSVCLHCQLGKKIIPVWLLQVQRRRPCNADQSLSYLYVTPVVVSYLVLFTRLIMHRDRSWKASCSHMDSAPPIPPLP